MGCSCFRPITAYHFSTEGFQKSTYENCNLRQTHRRNEEQQQLQEELRPYEDDEDDDDSGKGDGEHARGDAGEDAGEDDGRYINP
jgi:hypothetical protein